MRTRMTGAMSSSRVLVRYPNTQSMWRSCQYPLAHSTYCMWTRAGGSTLHPGTTTPWPPRQKCKPLGRPITLKCQPQEVLPVQETMPFRPLKKIHGTMTPCLEHLEEIEMEIESIKLKMEDRSRGIENCHPRKMLDKDKWKVKPKNHISRVRPLVPPPAGTVAAHATIEDSN